MIDVPEDHPQTSDNQSHIPATEQTITRSTLKSKHENIEKKKKTTKQSNSLYTHYITYL